MRLIGSIRDLAAIDPHLPRAPDLVRDVGRRDRAEERSRRTGFDLEGEDRLGEHRGDLLRLIGASSLVPGALRLDALELGDAGRRGGLGQPARQEVVARVTAGDVDDVTAQAELLHVLKEDDVHGDQGATYGSSAISRARLTAPATWSW